MVANTNPLTYNSYIAQVAQMAVVDVSVVNGVAVGDASWETLVPSMLNYAELRIQRDLDLLPLWVSSTYMTSIGNNVLTLPSNDFVTVQTIGVVVNAALTPLLPATKEFLQNVYGDSSATGTPQYFAMFGGDAASGGNTFSYVLLGPYPDAAYSVQVTGTIRAPSLYKNATPSLASTATTFISTYYPDMLVQASLIYIAQFQRNFLLTSNDPQMPGSYEYQYQALLRSALAEEDRKKFWSAAWSSDSVSPTASPTR